MLHFLANQSLFHLQFKGVLTAIQRMEACNGHLLAVVELGQASEQGYDDDPNGPHVNSTSQVLYAILGKKHIINIGKNVRKQVILTCDRIRTN